MVEMLVDQIWVFLHEVGVKCLHHEADSVSVQLGAQELREHLRSCGGQQVRAGCCFPAAAGCVQSLAKLICVGRLEVDRDVLPSAAAL